MVKSKTVSAIAISLFIVASVASTFAQGRYGNVYSRNDVSNFIRNLENSSDVFTRDFNNAGGTTNAERRNVERFENAVDRLRSRFDNNNSWWASRSEVQGIMTEARSVNVMMNNDRFARRLEVQWRNLRRDINRLADTYELPELGGNSQGGPWGSPGRGVGGSRPPAWAQGTFYATAPNGSQITLTISGNGSATADVGGSLNYGSYNRGILTMGYDTARVSRAGNGIRTVSTTDGETINYSRGGWSGDTPGYPDRPDRQGSGNAPDWAVGSFVGQNPVDGSSIYMTVGRNGTVTVSMGGNPSYGSMNGSMLTMGASQARVYRENNGFRTVSTGDGQTIYYRRQ